MQDIVVGAVIGIVASLLTTTVVKWMEWRRENNIRWDNDILAATRDALTASEGAAGRLYHWWHGGFPDEELWSEINDFVDSSHYKMRGLAILMPESEVVTDALNRNLSLLRQLSRFPKDTQPDRIKTEYHRVAYPVQLTLNELRESLLDVVQARLRISRRESAAWTRWGARHSSANPIAIPVDLVVGYEVQWRPEGAATWTSVTGNTGTTNPRFSFDGLPEGRQYEFRVRAINGEGPGDWSEVSAPIEPHRRTPPPPGRPAAKATLRTVELTWTAPAADKDPHEAERPRGDEPDQPSPE